MVRKGHALRKKDAVLHKNAGTAVAQMRRDNV